MRFHISLLLFLHYIRAKKGKTNFLIGVIPMDRTENAIFTNMCMIYDNNGNVLVQERVNRNLWR